MKIHVLVEGPSEVAFFDRWLPRAFAGHQFVTHKHQGKGSLPKDPDKPPARHLRGLLDLLPATLRGYADALATNDEAVIVVVDADDDDPVALRKQIEKVVRDYAPTNAVVRLAVEETEAYYLGDLHALRAAYPTADHAKAAAYQPDAIVAGGTAELFGEIIGDDGLRKVEWAEAMGARVTTSPARSRSPSFKALHAGLSTLIAAGAAPKPKRKKHWKSRHSALRKQAKPRR